MEFHLLSMFILSLLVPNGCNGALPGEVYWKSKLPNTPMPKTVQELLQPAGNKSTFSEAEIDVKLVQGQAPRASYNIRYPPNKESSVEKIANSTTIYFLYDDFVPNKKMMLLFTKSPSRSNFLPREIAKNIPFSSNKFSEILNYFSIEPKSNHSQILKQTIEQCEAPGIKGEDKYCATSLESMVDFVITKFGSKVQALSNEAEGEYKKQNYTILKGIKMIGDKHIVCHKIIYVYAVYYCHTIMATKVYLVPLLSDDGSKAKAVIICHTNTSSWNPMHISFQVLHVKPGGPPICHFLNSDTIVWVPN